MLAEGDIRLIDIRSEATGTPIGHLSGGIIDWPDALNIVTTP